MKNDKIMTVVKRLPGTKQLDNLPGRVRGLRKGIKDESLFYLTLKGEFLSEQDGEGHFRQRSQQKQRYGI